MKHFRWSLVVTAVCLGPIGVAFIAASRCSSITYKKKTEQAGAAAGA
jgi:hypothetical protein